jgi:hypothetical protein
MAAVEPPPAICANCGAAIPGGARACPECGADERTGWRETPVDDGLDLPPAEDEAPRPGPTIGRPPGWRHPLAWYWLFLAAALLVLLALGALGLL